MGVGIDVVQPHPSTQLAKLAGQIGDMAAHLAVFPRVHVVFAVQPVGAGVLTDDQQFLHACLDQLFSLAQHGMGGAGRQFSAHVGDDAELALVIAALGNLEIAVMARCQADAGRGQKIDKGVGRGRHGAVDGVQHLFVLVGACDGKDIWMVFADIIRLRPQTAGHDDLAVLLERLADCVEAFGLG